MRGVTPAPQGRMGGLRVDVATSRLVAGPATFQAFLRAPGTGRLLATDAVTLVLADGSAPDSARREGPDTTGCRAHRVRALAIRQSMRRAVVWVPWSSSTKETARPSSMRKVRLRPGSLWETKRFSPW